MDFSDTVEAGRPTGKGAARGKKEEVHAPLSRSMDGATNSTDKISLFSHLISLH